MDVGIKRKDELKDWLPKDPVKRVREYLLGMGLSPLTFGEMERKVRGEVEAALEFARESPYPDSSDLLTHLFVSGNGAT